MKAPAFWQSQRSLLSLCLRPMSFLFGFVVHLRSWMYQRHRQLRYRAACPVIIIGNISVGGTGKTPLLIWLVEKLIEEGFCPAVLTRGYGAKVKIDQAVWVDALSHPAHVGDEPVLIARRVSCPVVVARKRWAGVQLLEQAKVCDIIVCDDGLQHYALERDLEICVIDGLRRLGNQCLLPAGPLRESPSRLHKVDYIVTNITAGGRYQTGEWQMSMQPGMLRRVCDDTPLNQQPRAVIAMAGIGYPQRFFALLEELGMKLIECHAYPDHHCFHPDDLHTFSQRYPLLMTEKDAVKCRSFSRDNWYYMPVNAVLSEGFSHCFMHRVREIACGFRK